MAPDKLVTPSRASGSVVRLGKQPPRYRFFLNPYTDVRFMKCPQCLAKTRQRKLPLVIHIEPEQLVALNKTCRYCPHCDLLIAHQDQLETWLTAFFTEQRPEIVGNDYLVLGTQDRSDWLRGVHTPVSPETTFERLHDFREVVKFHSVAKLDEEMIDEQYGRSVMARSFVAPPHRQRTNGTRYLLVRDSR